MISRVTPQLPFLLVLRDELRKAGTARPDKATMPDDRRDGEAQVWVRPIDPRAGQAGTDASYVFTPAHPAA